MNKIGIIGGIGPASTLDYYKDIIDGCRRLTHSNDYPQIIIESINMTEMIRYLSDNQLDKMKSLLLNAIDHLALAGAKYGLMASNTPHIIFNEIVQKSPIPLISIVEATCRHIQQVGYRRVLILGTKFTMTNGLYSNELSKYHIETIVPDTKGVELVHGMIFLKLEEGIVDENDKKKMQSYINEMVAKYNIEAVILGCTELPLMIKTNDVDIPVINTTQIHINEAIQCILKK